MTKQIVAFRNFTNALNLESMMTSVNVLPHYYVNDGLSAA